MLFGVSAVKKSYAAEVPNKNRRLREIGTEHSDKISHIRRIVWCGQDIRRYGFMPAIEVKGKTVDEAVAELDKYLDDAYLSHLPSVRVVHGKGTGALRKGIHNYLRRQKHVADFHLAEFGEGDAGVTIVTFKK